MSFKSDLAKFAEKTMRNNNAIVRKVVIDMGTSLVLKTPVGNPKLWKNPDGAPVGYAGGRARANWQYGTGSMPDGVIDSIDMGGNNTVNKIIGGVQASPAASVHWISNSLPYIKRLEDGWSYRQAPQGMLKLTIEEFEQTVRSAVEVLK